MMMKGDGQGSQVNIRLLKRTKGNEEEGREIRGGGG